MSKDFFPSSFAEYNDEKRSLIETFNPIAKLIDAVEGETWNVEELHVWVVLSAVRAALAVSSKVWLFGFVGSYLGARVESFGMWTVGIVGFEGRINLSQLSLNPGKLAGSAAKGWELFFFQPTK